MIQLGRLDHLVLTVRDIDATCEFYTRVLGMEIITFGEGRKALRFASQKINLHQAGAEFEPKAAQPTPGSADLCIVAMTPLAEVVAHLERENVTVIEGPVERLGTLGKLLSIYVRDPDGNLIELSNYVGK